MVDELPEELEFIKANYTSALGNSIEIESVENNTLKINIELEKNESVDINVRAKVKATIKENTIIANQVILTGNIIGEIKSNIIFHAIEKQSDTEESYSINGIAWLDENKNGQRENVEPVLKDIKVHLLETETGTVLKTVMTNEKGEYEFTELKPKEYQILFEYDSKKYGVTEYKQNNVSELLNSDAIEVDYVENGIEKIGAATEILKVENESLLYIDLGLIIRDVMDLKLDKTISKVTVEMNGEKNVYDFDNEKIVKVEIPAKYLEEANVYIEYKIRVENEGDIPVYGISVVDYIAEEMNFNEALNPGWYKAEDGNLYSETIKDEIIEAGASKEITLILNKIMNENNLGNVNNTAEIAKSYNDYGVIDIDSTEGNQKQGEDDISSADCIISIATGKVILYIAFTVIMITVFIMGVYLIKVKVYDKGGKNNEQ